jgi:multiple sugar transport system ATP-binding protein
MIYVTHDQVEAMTLADRIVVLNGGDVQQVGSPLDLYDRPVNTFVAGFIGSPSMNFLEGGVTPEGFKTTDGILLPLQKNQDQATTYGVRPEHLQLAPTNGIPAEVVVVEPTGSDTQVLMRIGTQQVVGIFRERIAAKPGETIKVTPDLSVIHLFNQDGRRAN